MNEGPTGHRKLDGGRGESGGGGGKKDSRLKDTVVAALGRVFAMASRARAALFDAALDVLGWNAEIGVS